MRIKLVQVSDLLYDMVPRHVADIMISEHLSTPDRDCGEGEELFAEELQVASSRHSSSYVGRSAYPGEHFLNHQVLPGALTRRGNGSSGWGGGSGRRASYDNGVALTSSHASCNETMPTRELDLSRLNKAYQGERIPLSKSRSSLMQPQHMQQQQKQHQLQLQQPKVQERHSLLRGKSDTHSSTSGQELRPAYSAQHDSCTVLFADIVSFTEICQKLNPK